MATEITQKAKLDILAFLADSLGLETGDVITVPAAPEPEPEPEPEPKVYVQGQVKAFPVFDGHKLFLLRKDRDLNQGQLGRRAGISGSLVSNFESEKRTNPA